ncbi:MAG: RICIN domain-containing protein, partial [Candidatus Thermoplasmatota archaeon]|nr:RICIN domain-containing protein [Candidatus Thermoplasmatota archaeon]
MGHTLKSLKLFAIFASIVTVSISFHPAIDPVWDYISSLEDEEYEFFSSIVAASMNGDTIALNRQPENNINITELNAIAKANGDVDTDNDGLYDTVEILLGTDINNSDSDFDQLDDFFEVQHNLNPLNPDSNNDGISDYTEIYNVSLDLDGDGVPNAWDSDNDGDGVSDSKDLSPFSKTSLNDYFSVDIKTNGNPSFMDFQIRPKNPNHLTLPLQYWDWPKDAEGLMRDLDDSEEDVFILPYLELSIQTDFKIISKNSGKCLEVCDANTSENATVCQNTYSGADNQHWSIIPVSEGFVKIINTHSEKCLAVGQSSLDNGAAILQETYTGGDNQLWKLEFLGNNSYVLNAKHSDKCVEIFNASLYDNSTAIQSTYSGQSHQIWTIKDVKEAIPDQAEVANYGISIDLNKTLIPLTPIWDYGVVPAFNGKMYFPLSDALDISAETRLLWKVYGQSDTELKALTADNGQMVSANNTEGAIIANSSDTGDWETFEWVDLGPDRVALKAHNGKYIGFEKRYYQAPSSGSGVDMLIPEKKPYFQLVANSTSIGDNETFEIVEVNQNKIALKAKNKLYVSTNFAYDDPGRLTASATVIGKSETFTMVDLGYKSDVVPLVSYYEDFMITGFNFQENYGSSIGCFYNEDMNQTIKTGFVMAYEFLRNQNDLTDLPNIIENRNITTNSSINNNLAHQDESIFKLMSEMLPQAIYDLTNQSNDTVAPIIIAMQDYFTTKTLDDLTSGLYLYGNTIHIDVSESPVITSKMFKMNWYNTSNISLLSTEDVLLESMRWGLQFGFDEHNETHNETLVMMMGLLNVWNMGEFRITSVGGEKIQFNIAESPEVLNIIQYSVFSISSIMDVITMMTKFSK